MLFEKNITTIMALKFGFYFMNMKKNGPPRITCECSSLGVPFL